MRVLSYCQCRQDRYDLYSVLSVTSRQEGILGNEISITVISITVAAHSEEITAKGGDKHAKGNEYAKGESQVEGHEYVEQNEHVQSQRTSLYADQRRPLAGLHNR